VASSCVSQVGGQRDAPRTYFCTFADLHALALSLQALALQAMRVEWQQQCALAVAIISVALLRYSQGTMVRPQVPVSVAALMSPLTASEVSSLLGAPGRLGGGSCCFPVDYTCHPPSPLSCK